MRVLTDFNEVYDERFVWAVVHRDTVTSGEDPVQVGDWVELYDYDGTSCLGRVVEMNDETIDCEIDFDSMEYSSSDIPTFQGNYAAAAYFSSTLTPIISPTLP